MESATVSRFDGLLDLDDVLEDPLTIKTRLLLTFMVVSLLLGGSVAYVLGARRHMNDRTDALRQEVTEPLRLANELKGANAWEMTWVAAGIRTDANGDLRGKGSAEYRDSQEELFLVKERQLVDNITALEAVPLPDEQRALLARFKANTSAIQAGLEAELGRVTPVPVPGEPAATPDELIPLMWERSEDAKTLTEQLAEVQAQRLSELERQYDSTERNALVALVVAFGVAVAAALVIAAAIVRPVRRTGEVLAQVADGDLTPRLATGSDEIGQMNDALNRTLEQVGSVIQVIDEAAGDLASYSASFSERSAEVAVAATLVADDADAASLGIHDVTDAIDRAQAAIAGVDRAAEALTDRTGEAVDRAGRALEQARAARRGVDAVRPGSGLDGAAAALDALVDALERVEAVERRQVAMLEEQRATAQGVAAQLSAVKRSGGSLDVRLDSVAAAVSFSRQFIDSTKADADALSDLSQTLEVLTAVFKYCDDPSAVTPSSPPSAPGDHAGGTTGTHATPVAGVGEEVHS